MATLVENISKYQMWYLIQKMLDLISTEIFLHLATISTKPKLNFQII